MKQADFLAINVGNTNITIGLLAGHEVLAAYKIPNRAGSDDDAIRAGADALRGHALQGCPAAIASVNPVGTARAEKIVSTATSGKAIIFGRDGKIPIENRTTQPEQAGADRLINALAAFHRVKGPVIVVDFGTAICFNVVDASGAYLGGVITPGIGLAMRALNENTALLPLVKPGGKPDVIGRDTISAINSGVYYGYIGLVRNIIAELAATFPARPRVLATGGDGSYLATETGVIDEVVPHLTLTGIRIAYDESGTVGRH